MLRCRFIRRIGSFKMLSQLSAPLILQVASLGTLGSPKKTFFDSGKSRHSVCCNFMLPISPAIQKYQPLDSEYAKFSNIAQSDPGRARLGYSMLLVRIPNALDFKKLNRSFSATRAAYLDEELAVVDVESVPDGYGGSRISRLTQNAAQKALFEYLHNTRGLSYTDAEHISKNSPVFLQNLLAKIDMHDVGRSLSRFLRYHPINEFEPFFESLGLKPLEVQPLLPRNLMYLSDDEVLLENYQDLCSYGIPRSKVGKMYKEGTDMFRYGHGVLYSKLQAYEKLGLSRLTVIKLVVCCPALLVGDINIDFICVFMKFRELGVELDWIRGCLSDKSAYSWDRILDMLNFLNAMGCNKNSLAALIKNNPRFVFDDFGKRIYILVAVLLKLGLRMNNILTLFVQYPRILVGNFTKNLFHSVHFLVDIGMPIDDIARILSSHAQVFGSCYCKKSDVVLSSLKLSANRLCNIIKKDPSQFVILASRKKGVIINSPKLEGIFLQQKTNFLLKLGYIENSEEMAKALCKFRGRGDQLQERFDCLVNAGLDCHTVSEMIKLVPTILNQSTDVIEKKLGYLLNHLGYPLESLTAFPVFLCYNMEKIKVRFSMYTWLKNRKMVQSTVALATILACSDARFMKYFVSLHPEGPDEWEKLKSQYL